MTEIEIIESEIEIEDEERSEYDEPECHYCNDNGCGHCDERIERAEHEEG